MFWIRRLIMIALVAIVPVGLALWVDAQTAIERSKVAGSAAVERAASALSDRVALSVREQLDAAMAAAHDLEELGLMGKLGSSSRSRKAIEEQKAAATEAEKRLQSIRPEAGFAWLVDAEGKVVAAAGTGAVGRDISGHPLFGLSQDGWAGDLLWRDGEPLVWGAAAPLVEDAHARGAVVVGWPIDAAFVKALTETLDVDLTLLRLEKVVHSSLEHSDIEGVVQPALKGHAPVVAGSLERPLEAAVPMLPLLVGPTAEGKAFASKSVQVPGGPYRWVVSVGAEQAFANLAQRQIELLAVGLVLVMVMILFSVIEHRTLLAPIHQISEHLSEIQQGRGETELPELRVSRPFRRLVRLINMTVQKLPSRSLHQTLSGATLPPMPSNVGALPSSRPAAPSSASAPAPAQPPLEPAPSNDDLAEAIAALGASDAKPGSAPGSANSAPALPATMPGGSALLRRSASEVRGGTPAPELGGFDDDFYEVSQFTVAPHRRGTAGGNGGGKSSPVRGGGSFDLSQAAGLGDGVSKKPEGADSTVVAPVEQELLAQSARRDLTNQVKSVENHDMTVVANVDPKLLSQTADMDRPTEGNLDDADWSHFKEVYEDFIDLRRKCGERTADLGFERFLGKLQRNRAKLVEKYNCKTVRFQVYEKDGKAALKATPVRAR